jgi:hypothetical protein
MDGWLVCVHHRSQDLFLNEKPSQVVHRAPINVPSTEAVVQFAIDRVRKLLIVAALSASPSLLFAQPAAVKPAGARVSPPSGAEIASAARAAALDPGNAVTATILGKRFGFTPSGVAQRSGNGLEMFVGVLENGAAGDETGLPPGRYNILLAQVAGEWKGYAESGGQVAGKAVRTSVGAATTGRMRPTFKEKGWCISGMYYETSGRVGGGKSTIAYPWSICF